MVTTVKKTVLSTALIAAILATGATPALASPSPVSGTRIAAHFDLAHGQMPENIALEPDGTADVTFAGARQVAQVTPGGRTRILATLPAPADGGGNTPALGFALTTGLVRGHDGTLYVLYATGTADLTGLWRLRPGGTPRRIAALPADGLPNGLTQDPRTGAFYIADSVLGKIWTVPASGGTARTWSAATELAATGFLGANGVKVHDNAVWATNLDKGTVLRIPFGRDGGAGRVEVKASGLTSIDDFAFTGHGDQLLAALNGPSQVALVRPGGTHTIVLDSADGLRNPTSIAVRGNTVYVPSAAYVTETDPNLLITHLTHSR